MSDSVRLTKFAKMCADIGSLPDYVQGGGGNTSVKLDDERMAIKASGFQIKQITESEGYVVVDYKSIADYHKTVDTSRAADPEKEAAAFVSAHVLDIPGVKKLRPSVEAGFHSILKTYVTHTHPVYANILTCCDSGREIAEEIFKDRAFVWLPYINPGFELTLEMHKAIEKCIARTGEFPKIIFLQNHGLVTTSDDPEECNAIHKEVNEAVKAYFGIGGDYPALSVAERGDGFVVNIPYVSDFFKTHTCEVFEELTLYPDQLVYLNSNYKDGKIRLEGGEILVSGTYVEAMTIAETLLGYAFVIKNIEQNGKRVGTMGQAGVDFINSWESEKYRKSLAK